MREDFLFGSHGHYVMIESHKGLMKHFDLRVRFSEIEYTLKKIEANLSVFREISNQRQSNMLEWIIITLIMVEIVNLFISKIF